MARKSEEEGVCRYAYINVAVFGAGRERRVYSVARARIDAQAQRCVMPMRGEENPVEAHQRDSDEHARQVSRHIVDEIQPTRARGSSSTRFHHP